MVSIIFFRIYSTIENIFEFEKFCLMGHNALYSVKSQWIFRKKVSSPSSGSKSEPRIKNREVDSKQNQLPIMLHAGYLGGSLFDPEDGGDIFLPDIARLSTDCRPLYTKRQASS
jgi:hypothetical protein